MKKIKCYLAFTTGIYRILLFLVMPVAVIGLQAVISEGDSFSGLLTAVALIASAEVLADGFSFAGIASREAGGMEYLKSSARGQKILCTALSVNLVRQLLEEVLILLACQGISSSYRGTALLEKGELSTFFMLALLGYFMTVSGVAAVRFFSNIMFSMGVLCVEILPVLGILRLMMSSYTAAGVLLAVLTAAAGIGGIWFVMKRGRESYYDKTA